MRGLLWKDWRLSWKMARVYLLMIVCFAVGALFRPEVDFIGVYPFVLLGILPMTLLTVDENCGWLRYLQTTPLPKERYVTARYLSHAIALGVLLGLTAALRTVLRTPGTGELASVGLTLGLLLPGMMLPLALRFGVEKARLVHLIVVGLVTALVILTLGGGFRAAESLPQAPDWLPCAAALGFYAASWRLAVFLYQKREG